MLTVNNKHGEMKREAITDIMDALKNGYDGYYAELHNEVFNTDYYIIGTYLAKKVLNEYDVFDAIELVQEYERFNFGEVLTDCSNPEKLINMVYYIIGEEVIAEMNSIDEFNYKWNELADEETNQIILDAMKEMFEIE